jgi:hypothetical protein
VGILKYFEEIRRYNFEMAEKTWRDADKVTSTLIVALGTGAFVLSIQFVTGDTVAVGTGWLFMAWAGFIGALLCHGYYYWRAKQMAYRTMIVIDAWGSKDNFAGRPTDIIENDEIIKKHKWHAQVAEYVTYVLLVWGIISIFIFAMINVAVKDTQHQYEHRHHSQKYSSNTF